MVQLLDGLRDVSLASLDIFKTNSGVSTATKLAELLIADSKFKALASANLSRNDVIDEDARRALQEVASSQRPGIELIWDQKIMCIYDIRRMK